MNTETNSNDTNTRPFGYWITAVDRLMRAEFATVFEDEGITRRDWRMLNRIDGTFAARPGATDRPLKAHRLQRLIERGWVERGPEGWALTESGSLAKQRLSVAVDELRARVAGAVTPEEYATMTASLEKIAREFGWEEGRRLPRRERGDRRRTGRGGFGPHARRDGFGQRDGFGRRDHRGHGRGQRFEGRGHGFEGRRHRGHGFRGHLMPATHIHIHTHG
ncbi:MarR family winged helix-turn-helix transcriptional regulator [Microbacterium suwonense]|uniref:MarR family transcriptional regulator n=1 Tax=Microbacterium suwonense TaxID=683047 RepID=A0ABN6X5Z6_9MICO|nr:hypothetical protein [Microbacterium suwonense]BDZ40162.1 hypothetical protein GCM10025863_27760 [Microbacterium suwonense]